MGEGKKEKSWSFPLLKMNFLKGEKIIEASLSRLLPPGTLLSRKRRAGNVVLVRRCGLCGSKRALELVLLYDTSLACRLIAYLLAIARDTACYQWYYLDTADRRTWG